MPSPVTHARRQRGALVLSAAYLLALAIVVCWPEHVDGKAHDLWVWMLRAAPALFPFGIDVSLNVALFVPLGMILGALLPRRPFSVVGAAWTLSLLVEIGQGVFLPGRTSSAIDVAANTVGAAVGAGIAAVLRWRSRARPADRLPGAWTTRVRRALRVAQRAERSPLPGTAAASGGPYSGADDIRERR